MTALPDGPGATRDSELERLRVSDVSSALARRWAAIAEKYPDAGSHTATINLVTFINEAGAVAAVSNIIRDLAASHPIRAITAVENEAASDETVSAAIVKAAIMDRRGRPTCSEEIYLSASGDSAERMASAVFGLLEADLPVYLWWRAPSPYGSPLFRLIAPYADKLIVDSMRFGDTDAALDTVRRMAEHRAHHVAVTDLNWKRIRPWRQTIAACFDDPQTRALLDVFDRADVEFNTPSSGGAPLNARATLLAGWIGACASRLRNKIRVGPARSGDDGSGRIEAVCFSASSSKASLELRRLTQPVSIDARASDATGAQFRRWNFPAKTLSEAALLHMSLDDPERDPIFEAALNQA